MRYDPNCWRHTNCVVCHKGFMDDCGDVFCSSSCENIYEREHAKCERCENEFGEDNLNQAGICENCEEELLEMVEDEDD
jgi:hypothetical protein